MFWFVTRRKTLMAEGCGAKESEASSSDMEAYCQALKDDWEAVARYSVYRAQYTCPVKTPTRILHSGLCWVDAQDAREKETRRLKAEPGYRGGLMSSPLIGIQLEDEVTTKAAYQELCRQRRLRSGDTASAKASPQPEAQDEVNPAVFAL